jgi:hypothetical protein
MLRRTVAWSAAFAAFALANLGHLSNPGYFSHDELQWGWYAQRGLAYDWLDNGVFQYRPLTFQLWLPIARALFAHPHWYHALWIALGFGVCALLFATLRRAGAAPRIALFGAAAFALNPYAMYVHGWVATLAELLWTACALGIAWFALDVRRTPRAAGLAALALTALALCAKEAALAIPPLLALGWTLTRERRWCAALLGSAVPTVLYLAARLPTLLFAARPEGAYAWSLAHVPARWVEFQVWPLIPHLLEMSSLFLARPGRLLLPACVAAATVLAVLQAHRRSGVALLAAPAIAIGPAIVLATGYPQYGYAASIATWSCIAWSWPTMRRTGRAVVGLVLLANFWHGANVQREMRRVGGIEAVFSPSLHTRIVHPGTPLTLIPDVASDVWIYRRLSWHLPEAQRQVDIALDGDGLRVRRDGRIVD